MIKNHCDTINTVTIMVSEVRALIIVMSTVMDSRAY